MLYEERFVCAMRAGHPALQEAWNLDTFCRQRFALGSFYGGSLSGTIDDTLRELGYTTATSRCRCNISPSSRSCCGKATCSPSSPPAWYAPTTAWC